MQATDTTSNRAASLAVASALLLGVAAAAGAPAAAAPAPPALGLTALTGPQGGTLALEVAPDVEELEHVHLQLRAPNATEVATRNLKAVVVDRGVATIELGPLARGTAIDAKVQIKATNPRPVN